MKNNLFDKLYDDVLMESSLSRIWAKTQNHSCGTITSFRGDKPYDENIRNNKKILSYLQSKGYSVTSILGTYIEGKGSPDERDVNERSFFVCNDKVKGDDGGQLANDLFKLGELFDQDSVLIIPVGGKAYLWGTSNREHAYPSYNSKEEVGSGRFGKVAGEFLSKIKGREFAFENINLPQTINGKRGQMILLKEIKKELNEL
jgi:hypothetical protein